MIRIDIANQLPTDFTKTELKNKSLISQTEQLIAQLKEENKVLTIQNELLMKLRG